MNISNIRMNGEIMEKASAGIIELKLMDDIANTIAH